MPVAFSAIQTLYGADLMQRSAIKEKILTKKESSWVVRIVLEVRHNQQTPVSVHISIPLIFHDSCHCFCIVLYLALPRVLCYYRKNNSRVSLYGGMKLK